MEATKKLLTKEKFDKQIYNYELKYLDLQVHKKQWKLNRKLRKIKKKLGLGKKAVKKKDKGLARKAKLKRRSLLKK